MPPELIDFHQLKQSLESEVENALADEENDESVSSGSIADIDHELEFESTKK